MSPSCISYKTKGILSIIGGFIMHLSLGGFYLWGSINIYFTSYYRIISEPDLQTSKSVILAPIIDFLAALSMFNASFFISKLGLRGTSLVMGLAIALMVFLCSFMPNFLSYILLFGLVYGYVFGVLW
jgi:hypothetical protein